MSALFALFLLICPARAEEAAPTEFQKSAAFFQMKCAKCHTIGRGDRVGPDLKGLAKRRPRAWTLDFLQKTGEMLDKDPEAQALLRRFNGVRMEDVGLSRAQAESVLDYIEAAAEGPAAPAEPPEPPQEEMSAKLRMPEEGTRLWLPGVAAALLLAALCALARQLGSRAGAALAGALALGAGYWSLGGRRYHRLLGNQQGYAPEQPIAFSHRTHAGKLKVDCLYCHFGARASDAAGVPPAQVCMNCHGVVRQSRSSPWRTGEIAKLLAAWDSRDSAEPKPIQWVRVHKLPDYVHFPHRVHLANGILCQECHGPVQTMARMRQAGPLSMGWCVNCHRQKAGEAPSHWKRSEGPLDCAACHW